LTDLPKHQHIDSTTKTRDAYAKAKGDVKKMKDAVEEQARKDTDDVIKAGQENRKKAIKEIDRIEKREQETAKKAQDDVLNALDMKKRRYTSYKTELAKALRDILSQLDWVRGWTADVVVTNGSVISIKGKPFQTKDGLLLVVCTPDGRVMHQGMLVTGEPPLDYAGIYNLALQTENTMDKERGLLLTSHNGDANVILDKDGRPIAKQSEGRAGEGSGSGKKTVFGAA